jgi:acid stress-induced BolA-like protein IbaG/YrbA
MPDAHDALHDAIVAALPDARVTVSGAVGHYTLSVVSRAFEGRSMLESHRLVYAAIAPLMKGDNAPVHAIDQLTTRAG